jgi:hypothetical protein
LTVHWRSTIILGVFVSSYIPLARVIDKCHLCGRSRGKSESYAWQIGKQAGGIAPITYSNPA